MNKSLTMYRREDFFERDGTNKASFWGVTLTVFFLPVLFLEEHLPFSTGEKYLLLKLTYGVFLALLFSRCEAIATVVGSVFGALLGHFIVLPILFYPAQHVEISLGALWVSVFLTAVSGYITAMMVRSRRNNVDEKLGFCEYNALVYEDCEFEKPPIILACLCKVLFFILLISPSLMLFYVFEYDNYSLSFIFLVYLISFMLLFYTIKYFLKNNNMLIEKLIVLQWKKEYCWFEWQKNAYNAFDILMFVSFVFPLFVTHGSGFVVLLYLFHCIFLKLDQFGLILAEMMRDVIRRGRRNLVTE